MCGVVGIYRFRSGGIVSPEEITGMSQTFVYRGPDDSGELCENNLGLGHRRLSIIDTSTRSKQPMESNDKDFVITYNGEVFNFVELRQELEKQGSTFKTASDTEVILEMYRKHGEKCVNYMIGMFAFAIWDRKNQSLFIARDRMGIKPLYYNIDDQGIVFASEIKAILKVLKHKPVVNMTMFDAYMSVGYTPTENTLFQGIFKLKPGHSMLIQNGQVSTKQYWDLEFDREKDLGEAYYIEKTKQLLEDAVRLRLRSDVPLGVFLSGGLDSSAIVSIMHKQGIKDIKTFSVAWDSGKLYDETPYARKISKLFNTDHHEYIINPDDFLDFIPTYIWHMEEPVTEAAAISLFYCAKVAKEHVTVVLSGEGSDEVFGGYPIYNYMQTLEKYRQIPSIIRKGCLNPLFNLLGGKWNKYTNLSNLPIEERYQGVSFYDQQLKNNLYTEETRQAISEHTISHSLDEFYRPHQGADIQTKMQYLDVKTWLVDDLLIKADRMSMATSLELRVPFLDHRLMEFSATIPTKYRLKKGITKYVIKKAMEDYLPNDIIHRKKMGFPTPLSTLFKGDLQNYARNLLDSDRFHNRGYFKPDKVRKILDEHIGGSSDHHKILWQLVVLEEWHRKFID